MPSRQNCPSHTLTTSKLGVKTADLSHLACSSRNLAHPCVCTCTCTCTCASACESAGGLPNSGAATVVLRLVGCVFPHRVPSQNCVQIRPTRTHAAHTQRHKRRRDRISQTAWRSGEAIEDVISWVKFAKRDLARCILAELSSSRSRSCVINLRGQATAGVEAALWRRRLWQRTHRG